MTTLYRFTGERGRLLYVGITDRPGNRFLDHSQKSWWAEVTDIRMESYDSRAEAAAAEAEAIRMERPAYNIKGTGRSHPLPSSRPTEYETIAAAAARLGVNPKTLRRRIADGRLTGYRLGSLVRLDPREVDALLRPIPTVGLPS